MWDRELPRYLWILLNPSDADEKRDDPTNRRGMGFVRQWGGGSCVFANLNGFRTPYPKELAKAEDLVGPENDAHILAQADLAGVIVLAWGAHPMGQKRSAHVLDLLGDRELFCLGKTGEGHPRHPLYLAKTTPLERWKP